MQALRKVVKALRTMDSSLVDSHTLIVVGSEIAMVSSCEQVMGMLRSPGQMAFAAFIFDRPTAVKVIHRSIPFCKPPVCDG